MAGNAVDTTIKFLKLTSSNLENQMTNNSMDLRLITKYNSDKLAALEAEFTQEKDLIQNEMNAIGDKTSVEYEALMGELEDLRDELDRKEKKLEEENSVREEKINSENSLLETQNEAIHADIEAYKECRQKSIEDNFGYFQK